MANKIISYKLKQRYLAIILFISMSVVWVLNESLKNPLTTSIAISESHSIMDTVINSKLPLYADTTLSSGYFGNYAIIQNQILNSKRIDSLLKSPLPIYYALTEEDKKNDILSIDQKAIKRRIDTIIYEKKYRVIYLPVKLTNYSKDTLKYINMDCSWLDCYFTNNNRIKFVPQICFHNVPDIYMIAPQQTVSIYIPIVLNEDKSSFNQKFRIGMSLQKYLNRTQLWDFDPFNYFLRTQTSNMIWSNEVELLP